jgi:hypothetical protein
LPKLQLKPIPQPCGTLLLPLKIHRRAKAIGFSSLAGFKTLYQAFVVFLINFVKHFI